MSRQYSATFVRNTLAWLLFVVGFSCADEKSEPASASSSAVTSGAAECDKTPIDRSGTLPACAAGRAVRGKPGVPDDYSGPINGSLVLTASDLAAQALAAQIEQSRNPAGANPVDLGFAPIPAAALAPAQKAGAQ